MSNDGVKLKKAKLLADGWQWKIYDDGSGISKAPTASHISVLIMPRRNMLT